MVIFHREIVYLELKVIYSREESNLEVNYTGYHVTCFDTMRVHTKSLKLVLKSGFTQWAPQCFINCRRSTHFMNQMRANNVKVYRWHTRLFAVTPSPSASSHRYKGYEIAPQAEWLRDQSNHLERFRDSCSRVCTSNTMIILPKQFHDYSMFFTCSYFSIK